jgi:hypothetical protein
LVNGNAEIIDLEGKVVIPGLIESHCHAASAGTELLNEVNLHNARNINDILGIIKNKTVSIEPGKWIKGIGYNENNLEERRHLNKWELDKVSPNNPVFIQRIDYHQGIANSLALDMANINKNTFLDLKNGRIYREEYSAEPNGLLAEAAQGLVKDLIPSYSISDLKKGIIHACEILSKWGITSFSDAAVEHDPFVAYQELYLENKLPLRVGLIIEGFDALGFKGFFEEMKSLGLITNFGNDYLRIIGVKIFTDGSLSGGTAALYQPYNNNPNNFGVMNSEGEVLNRQIKDIYNAGLRPIIHAIGDRAIDEAINGIEETLSNTQDNNHRIRIEHCNLTHRDALEKIIKNKLIVSSSITHLYELGNSHSEALGYERTKNYFRLKTLLKKGAIIVGNSDWPITCGNPFLGIHTAVNRKDIDGNTINVKESISVEEALKLYTLNAAYASFDENNKGSLKPGKYADLVIIDRDIYNIPKEEIKDIQVLSTMVNGNFVYQKRGILI